jgi:hypothetical protein
MVCGADRSDAAGLSAVLAYLRLGRLRLLRSLALVLLGGLAVAGCATSGTSGGPVMEMTAFPAFGPVGAAAAPPRSVAFESIDGPPEPLFRRLVAQLSQEANARKVAVVSREQPAQYVIRGYMAAHVQGQRTTITWVWDVFTANHERVARFTGEVPGGRAEHAWAAADDAVVTRVARDGMDRLAAFLATSAPPQGVASAGGAEPLAFLPARP